MRFNQKQGSAIEQTGIEVVCPGHNKCKNAEFCGHGIPHKYNWEYCDQGCGKGHWSCKPVNIIAVFNEKEL